VSNSSPFEVEIVIANLKRYKSPGSDQIQVGGGTLRSEINKLVNSISPDQWKESIIVPVYKDDKSD
jgi:hypothetical protein